MLHLKIFHWSGGENLAQYICGRGVWPHGTTEKTTDLKTLQCRAADVVLGRLIMSQSAHSSLGTRLRSLRLFR